MKKSRSSAGIQKSPPEQSMKISLISLLKWWGEDNAKEIFESNDISNIAEMDLGEIDAAYRGVLDGFARPDREAVAKENLKVLGNPMIQQMLNIAEGMDKLQGALKEND